MGPAGRCCACCRRLIFRAPTLMPASLLSSGRLKKCPCPRLRASDGAAMKRDFLDLASLGTEEFQGLLTLASRLKAELKIGIEHPHLRGKTLAMIFQKPSLRTRITFETGMAQLGGHAIYL